LRSGVLRSIFSREPHLVTNWRRRAQCPPAHRWTGYCRVAHNRAYQKEPTWL